MEIINFKHLLEYFVSHLEWCQNEDVNFIGYEKYIKNLVKKNKFRKAGQGYNGDKIQLQIKEWENYSIGKICINISGYTPNRYISEFCYLNWLGTGINICAKWESSNIKSLYLTEYRYWEDSTPRVNLETEYSLFELKLFEEGITSELETFFDKYKNYFIQFKQMNNIQKTLNLLKYKKQIILQGPPGTGKTRQAKQIAKALLNIAEDKNLKSSEQFRIIQFHPSYSYEDFVRGIVAKPNSNGDGIIYEAENKILAKFAQKALENHRTPEEIPLWLAFKNHLLQYQLLEKELYFSESIRFKDIYYPDTDNPMLRYEYCYDGNNWSMQTWIDIKQMFNHTDFGKNVQFSKHIEPIINYSENFTKKQPKKIYDLKNFVLIIDEINRANLSSVLGELIYALEYRGEPVDSMYEVDGSNKITLPPNLYIIGTMNTADRSVGHIDYAIRRRFAFVDVLPKDLSGELADKFDSEKFKEVEKLFDNHLSQEFKKEEVQLGHSYFTTENIDIQTRLKYEIKPILREYVKDGVLKELAIKEINNL